MTQPQSLKDILKYSPKKSSVTRGILAAGAVDAANQFIYSKFGEPSKKLARAVYVKNQILVIASLSPIMAQEIKMQELQLIATINEKCGPSTVLKIQYLS